MPITIGDGANHNEGTCLRHVSAQTPMYQRIENRQKNRPFGMKPLIEMIINHTLHPSPHIIHIRSIAPTIIHSTRSQPPHLIISVANEDNSISIVMRKRSGKQALHVVVSKGVNIHKYSLFRRHGIDNFDIFVVGHNCRGHTIFIPKTI